MPYSALQNSCRMCGATSYRRVIARDNEGAMRPTGLYQCSGCSVVFADPRAWRYGEGHETGSDGTSIAPLTPIAQNTGTFG